MKTTVILFLAAMLGNAVAQDQWYQLRPRLVDLPTAGTLERGSYQIDLRMYAGGGLLSSVSIGITERVLLGMSYGGGNVIGQGDVNWNPEPGIEARIRVIDEGYSMPAVTVGFESQGFGPYSDEFQRYETKSRGLFAVASKTYSSRTGIGFGVGFHGGVNWSLENEEKDKEFDVFLGLDLSPNPEFHGFLEYDFANNDNENDSTFGSGRGYFNGGVQWIFANRLYLQLNVKNIFQNGPNMVRREFKVGYFEYF